MLFPCHKIAFLLPVAVAACVVGCGGAVKQEGQALRAQSLLESSPPLKRAIVSDEEIAKYPPNSVQHAFFSFWQALQFHSWREGLSWYDPGLQRFVGPQQIIDGLEMLASYYRAVKPVLYSVKSTNYGTTEVHYLGAPPTGPTGIETVEWRRVGGDWRIEFDSFLSQGLVSYAEEAEQELIDPSAQTPSRHAIRVGEAAGHLQAGYLATLIDRAQQARSGSHRSH
jgi:hypothetical protein